jgi:toxin HigB-1
LTLAGRWLNVLSVDVRFDDEGLDRLETDPAYNGRFSPAVVKAFRKRMQAIRAAGDERTFYAMKSWHFEKLKGDRAHQHSIMLNDQWRLVLEFEGQAPSKRVVIKGIEDYH